MYKLSFLFFSYSIILVAMASESLSPIHSIRYPELQATVIAPVLADAATCPSPFLVSTQAPTYIHMRMEDAECTPRVHDTVLPSPLVTSPPPRSTSWGARNGARPSPFCFSFFPSLPAESREGGGDREISSAHILVFARDHRHHRTCTHTGGEGRRDEPAARVCVDRRGDRTETATATDVFRDPESDTCFNFPRVD